MIRATPMTAPARRAEAVPTRWPAWQRVLVVRLDNLGDVLMTTPAIAAVRRACPQAHVTLLASPAGAALAPWLPDVDDAIAFRAPWVAPPRDAAVDERPGQDELAMVRRLAAGRYDAAIIFTVCTQSALPAALMCRMAGIPHRLAHSRESAYGLLSVAIRETDAVADGMRHEVQRQLDLVAQVGWSVDDPRLRLQLQDADRHRVRRRLAAAGLAVDQPYLVVHPGATAPSRRYPAERLGMAAGRIAAQRGLAVVLTGGADDAGALTAARAATGGPSIVLGGGQASGLSPGLSPGTPPGPPSDLTLGELAALIAGAELLLANNSGPAHVAAAVGTPLVCLYAQTNPQHTPWRVPARVLSHEVPCRHCLKSVCPQGHHACLLGVEVDDVVDAGLSLLSASPRLPDAVPWRAPAGPTSLETPELPA